MYSSGNIGVHLF